MGNDLKIKIARFVTVAIKGQSIIHYQQRMKAMLILTSVFFGISLSLSSKPIRPEDAGKHIGEVLEVRGEVRGYTNGGGTTYINFGDAYPRQNFTIALDKKKILDGECFHSPFGREIVVKGKIENHSGKPRLVVQGIRDIRYLPVDEKSAIEGPIDGVAARGRFAAAWHQILMRNGFETIEKQAATFEKKGEMSMEGMSLILGFFGALAIPDESNEDGWKAAFQRVECWREAFPDSPNALHAKAGLLVNYAWAARGFGFADKVTEEGWKKFRERIVSANVVLESIPEGDSRPDFYLTRQAIAMSQGWSREAVMTNLRASLDKFPGCFEIYIAVCTHLLPRWYGEEQEWQKFIADQTKEETPFQKELYTRACWAMADFYPDAWHEIGVLWPRFKAGFEEIERRYPASMWNLNNFARFAMKNDDKATCSRLLKKIEGREDMQVWLRWTQFEDAKKWAMKRA